MAYHEAYWAVIGTGAPVVGLAHTVALPRFAQRARELTAPERPRSMSLAVVVVIVYTLFGFGFTLIALLTALNALATERDLSAIGFGSAYGAAALLAVSFVLIPVIEGGLQIVETAAARPRQRNKSD